MEPVEHVQQDLRDRSPVQTEEMWQPSVCRLAVFLFVRLSVCPWERCLAVWYTHTRSTCAMLPVRVWSSNTVCSQTPTTCKNARSEKNSTFQCASQISVKSGLWNKYKINYLQRANKILFTETEERTSKQRGHKQRSNKRAILYNTVWVCAAVTLDANQAELTSCFQNSSFHTGRSHLEAQSFT